MGERDIDQALVERVQRGDKTAFDLLVLKYQHRVVKVISRYVRDQSEVYDVAQEAFIKAYRALRTSDKTRSIPIVVLTGLTRLDDFFGDLGDLPQPDELVEKPIERDDFLAKVQKLIG